MREVKDSGVEWLEKIPTDWNIIRMTKCFKFFKGLDIKKTDLVQYGSAVISYGQVHDKLNNGYSLQKNLIRYIDQSMLETKGKSRLSNGDFIFADTSEDFDGVGSCIYIDSNDELYAGYHTLVARCIDPNVYNKYLAFLFLTDAWRSQLRRNANGTKVYSVTQRMFKFVSCLLPPVDIQLKIVAYLEQKCDDVDNIIAREQSVIEKLQEYKKALITEAVTKGLNPNENMKESGLDWIGKVPETYSLIKLKFLGEYFNGLTYSPDNLTDIDEGVLVLRSSNIKNGKLVLDDNVYVNIDTPRYLVKKNDILICSRNGSRNLIGKNILLSEDIHAYFGAFMMIFRLKSEVYSKWVYYVLNSNLFLAYLGSFFSSTINQLTGKDFGNIIIPICDVEEAKQITECLDEKCSNIDSIILKKQFTIDRLIEYKKSLIYEVVTGKKEVSHV